MLNLMTILEGRHGLLYTQSPRCYPHALERRCDGKLHHRLSVHAWYTTKATRYWPHPVERHRTAPSIPVVQRRTRLCLPHLQLIDDLYMVATMSRFQDSPARRCNSELCGSYGVTNTARSGQTVGPSHVRLHALAALNSLEFDVSLSTRPLLVNQTSV